MKKTILIFALSRSPWIGGIYYKKNIINMMLHSDKIMGNYKIAILVNQKHKKIFDCFAEQIEIVVCPDNTNILKAGFTALKCCIKHRVRYVFPIKPYFFLKIMGITPVSWIADFQHCYYPEFFAITEVKNRNYNFRRISRGNNPLVVSSDAALRDFRRFYSKKRNNVYVVHFTSAINDELEKMKNIDEKQIVKKYGLENRQYFMVCNQFWKHKNHIVVLRALKIIKREHPEYDVKVAFTGEPNDRRNPEYIDEIKCLMEEPEIKNNVVLLGFINRTEQLCLMRKSKAIIQPSLFEGWGTVVEDAKVLNKRIILSNIDVHMEQKNENCIIFEKDSAVDLAKKILGFTEKSVNINMDYTSEYAKELERIFT